MQRDRSGARTDFRAAQSASCGAGDPGDGWTDMRILNFLRICIVTKAQKLYVYAPIIRQPELNLSKRPAQRLLKQVCR